MAAKQRDEKPISKERGGGSYGSIEATYSRGAVSFQRGSVEEPPEARCSPAVQTPPPIAPIPPTTHPTTPLSSSTNTTLCPTLLRRLLQYAAAAAATLICNMPLLTSAKRGNCQTASFVLHQLAPTVASAHLLGQYQVHALGLSFTALLRVEGPTSGR
jgi:hypothetical protein